MKFSADRFNGHVVWTMTAQDARDLAWLLRRHVADRAALDLARSLEAFAHIVDGNPGVAS